MAASVEGARCPNRARAVRTASSGEGSPTAKTTEYRAFLRLRVQACVKRAVGGSVSGKRRLA